jgi:hypothetical protein
MTFPATQETFADEANEVAGVGGTFTDANKQNAVYQLLEQMQLTYGLSGDAASPTGSHTGQLKYLLNASGGIVQSPTAPGSPLDGTLWLDNDEAPSAGLRRYYLLDTAWYLVGADALTIGSWPLHTADVPVNGDAIVWDAANNRFTYAPVTVGSPLTTPGDLYFRNAAGVDARLPIGNTEGMILARVTGLPAWVTAPYLPAPGSPQQGDTLYYDGANWVRLGAGTSGQFLKTQGPSANPLWSALPAAGGAITSPAGSVQGDVLYHNGTDWVRLPASTSGFFLKTNGSGANPAWAAPPGGMTNPMTGAGQLITSTLGGAPARLDPTVNGYVLTLTAGTPVWAASASGGHVIQDEGTLLTSRSALNFIGANITATDDSANNRTNVTVTGSGHTIQNEGTALTGRSGLNFVGAAVTAADDSGNDRTNVTVQAYSTIKNPGGSSLTQRDVLKFTGSGITISDVGGETVVDVPAATGGHTIQEEGTALTARAALNFIGASITATDDAGNNRTNITVTGGGHTIQEEGSGLTTRAALNFVGAGVVATDDSANNRTNITIAGVAGGWALDGNTVGAEKWLGTVDAYRLPFRTAGSERMALYPSGNLLSLAPVSGAARLAVQGHLYQVNSIDATITCSRSGTTVSWVSGTTFAPQHVGRLLQWADGTSDVITAYTSTTQVSTLGSGTVASQVATVKGTGWYVNDVGDACMGGANPTSLGTNTPTLELRGGQPELNKSGGLYWRNWDGTRRAVAHYTSLGLFKLGTTTAHDAQFVANDIQKLQLVTSGNVRVHPTATQDNSFAYNTSSLLVTQQTPTATATLNDPQSVLYLVRDGTAAQSYAAGAAFRLSRYENNGTNSRSRLDLSLAHTNFDVQSNTAMTWLSSGNVGIGTPEIGAKLDVEGTLACTTDSGSFTASKATTTVTATVGTFAATDLGKLLVWADGTVDVITAFIDATHVTVAASATISSQTAVTRNARFYVSPNGNCGINTANPGNLGANITVLEIRGGFADPTRGGALRMRSFDLAMDAAFYMYDSAFQFGSVSAHPMIFLTTNTERARMDPNKAVLYINTATNAFMSTGLTIHQGSATNEILALKASGLAHGMTTLTETNSYATWQLYGANGGVDCRGYASPQSVGMRIMGIADVVTGNAVSKATTSEARIIANGSDKSGTTSAASATANTNIFGVQTGSAMRALIDSEGDLHLDATSNINVWDDYDDVALLEAYRVTTARVDFRVRLAEDVDSHAAILAATGVLTLNADGHHFVSTKGMFGLLIDALRQERRRALSLDERLARLERALPS